MTTFIALEQNQKPPTLRIVKTDMVAVGEKRVCLSWGSMAEASVQGIWGIAATVHNQHCAYLQERFGIAVVQGGNLFIMSIVEMCNN